ncbi:MAG: hypothetical protein JSV04_03740 [Candidatus Heimdallarchaeota archaeon]|nr:MAG: hypothetical protein JSV04_03740 [Candidatus Heimdallarchaeota archaeon]
MSFPMKIVMIGDPQQSRLLEFIGEVFRGDFTLIPGPDFAFKVMNIGGNTLNFQVYQLSKDPTVKNERSRYYYGALGAVISIDVTQPSSFESIPSWLEEIWTYNGKETMIPIVIVGLNIHERAKIHESISDNTIEIFVREKNEKHNARIQYIPVNERTGENVAKIWEYLGKWYINYLRQFES